MTKFEDPSFSSPANSEAYRKNFDKVFSRCKTKGCSETRVTGFDICYGCLDEKGLLTDSPETD